MAGLGTCLLEEYGSGIFLCLGPPLVWQSRLTGGYS